MIYDLVLVSDKNPDIGIKKSPSAMQKGFIFSSTLLRLYILS
jgi:hypothetical protein